MPPVFLYIVTLLSNLPSSLEKLYINDFLKQTIRTWNETISTLDEYHIVRLWTGNVMFLLVLPLWTIAASSL